MVVQWWIRKVTSPDVTFHGFHHGQGSQFVEGGSSMLCATQLELHNIFYCLLLLTVTHMCWASYIVCLEGEDVGKHPLINCSRFEGSAQWKTYTTKVHSHMAGGFSFGLVQINRSIHISRPSQWLRPCCWFWLCLNIAADLAALDKKHRSFMPQEMVFRPAYNTCQNTSGLPLMVWNSSWTTYLLCPVETLKAYSVWAENRQA